MPVDRNRGKNSAGEAGANKIERPNAGSPAYVARIQLDENTIMVDGKPEALGPGMAVTGEIKTGRRTIMDYLLSPLVRHTTESLRER